MARRGADGRLRTELTTEAAVRASVIAAGLGTTSAHTWLKVPVVDDMERVVAATTLPTVLLGGEVSDDQDATFERWRRALRGARRDRPRRRSLAAVPAGRRRRRRGRHRRLAAAAGGAGMSGGLLRAGATAEGPFALSITPETAGWGFSGLRVLELEPGGAHALATAARTS